MISMPLEQIFFSLRIIIEFCFIFRMFHGQIVRVTVYLPSGDDDERNAKNIQKKNVPFRRRWKCHPHFRPNSGSKKPNRNYIHITRKI